VKPDEEFRIGSSTWKLAVLGVLTLIASSAFAGQITLYEQPEFMGQSLTTTTTLPNLDRSPLNEVASSAVVSDGTWEACTEPYFRGHCAQLAPGTYHELDSALLGQVVSVREIGYDPAPVSVVIDPDSPPLAVNSAPLPVVVNPAAAPVVITPAPGSTVVGPVPQVVATPQIVSTIPAPVAARVILYQHTGRGIVRAVELSSSVDDLDVRQFSNSADSALVNDGVWRLCDGEGGRGHCADFQPGAYTSLGALSGKVRSAYIVATAPDRLAAMPTVPAGRAVLYEQPNFGGARAVVEYGPAPDLDWAHFRNPASSLRIESGSWLVCSDLGYQGDCQVLDPGDYPVLTGLLSRGIASARQVWRPEYGSLGQVVAHDGEREYRPDLSRLVP
jgi:Beta/Gamma crystallin